jgi:hypothetical protein
VELFQLPLHIWSVLPPFFQLIVHLAGTIANQFVATLNAPFLVATFAAAVYLLDAMCIRAKQFCQPAGEKDKDRDITLRTSLFSHKIKHAVEFIERSGLLLVSGSHTNNESPFSQTCLRLL